MNPDCPTGKIKRTLTGGKAAAKIGGKLLSYYAKRPFLSEQGKEKAKEKTAAESGQAMFKSLSRLKGTALKMAQLLSLETDLLPEEACRELSKAYHQVPPINKALARNVVQNGLGCRPEQAFTRFETTAFAAASLGQVHRAWDDKGNSFAVKLQYPGIAATIKSDLSLLRNMMMPFLKKEQLVPTLNELAARLYEEVDYEKEADNIRYFSKHLKIKDVFIPEVASSLSSKTVLTTALLPGRPLDQWLLDNPSQKDKNYIAQKLQEIFIKTVYKLNCIHADPNPGNFIIAEDLSIGLVDFGCIKHLNPDFVELYRQLSHSAYHNNEEQHLKFMIQTGLLSPDLDSSALQDIKEFSDIVMIFFGALAKNETFDFKANPGFIASGRKAMKQARTLRRHFKVNPEYIFLDRTRYGLLRIFEKMNAKLSFRNKYEW